MQPTMEDGDAKRLQRQIDELASEVRTSRAETRYALKQACVARWCSTQLTHVLLDMMAKRDVLTAGEIRAHLERTLALMRPHRKQDGMGELAKEIELLLSKLGSDPRDDTSVSRPSQVN